ncbi:MAG: hypothetical protein IJ298_09900 [Ruminococcus sp.]|nr:hypothetical protein [Ruminococcus sp.]
MIDRNRGKGVPPEMLMNLAENAKGVNLYAGLGPCGQQFFLDKFTDSDETYEKKQIEELSK